MKKLDIFTRIYKKEIYLLKSINITVMNSSHKKKLLKKYQIKKMKIQIKMGNKNKIKKQIQL